MEIETALEFTARSIVEAYKARDGKPARVLLALVESRDRAVAMKVLGELDRALFNEARKINPAFASEAWIQEAFAVVSAKYAGEVG